MPFKYEDMRARILANTVIAPVETTFRGSPCWWWIGARAANGRYGKLSERSKKQVQRYIKGVLKTARKNKHRLAHRVARAVFKGEVFRRGHYACHMCNPHPNRTLCCNPDHISPGTPRQNNRQTVAEGRHRLPN